MTIKKHGLSIGIERIDVNFFLTLRVVGKLIHQDYLQITPMLTSALKGIDSPKVNVLFDATEFDCWELRAAWDDLTLGLKHGANFEKIAILGRNRWQDLAATLGSWFIAGEIRSFEQLADALSWLTD